MVAVEVNGQGLKEEECLHLLTGLLQYKIDKRKISNHARLFFSNDNADNALLISFSMIVVSYRHIYCPCLERSCPLILHHQRHLLQHRQLQGPCLV